MRQAADVLSSAPAMQIRYLEVMQAMAKSPNTKVIFLPGTNKVTNKLTSTAIEPVDGDEPEGRTAIVG